MVHKPVNASSSTTPMTIVLGISYLHHGWNRYETASDSGCREFGIGLHESLSMTQQNAWTRGNFI